MLLLVVLVAAVVVVVDAAGVSIYLIISVPIPPRRPSPQQLVIITIYGHICYKWTHIWSLPGGPHRLTVHRAGHMWQYPPPSLPLSTPLSPQALTVPEKLAHIVRRLECDPHGVPSAGGVATLLSRLLGIPKSQIDEEGPDVR